MCEGFSVRANVVSAFWLREGWGKQKRWKGRGRGGEETFARTENPSHIPYENACYAGYGYLSTEKYCRRSNIRGLQVRCSNAISRRWIESGKFKLLFASAEDALQKDFLSSLKNDKTEFHQNSVTDKSHGVPSNCKGFNFEKSCLTPPIPRGN